MIMRASKLAALATAVLFAIPAIASAALRRAPRAVEHVDEPPPAHYSPRNTSGRCIPWCDRDMSPCDPPSFKISDGRCAGITNYGR